MLWRTRLQVVTAKSKVMPTEGEEEKEEEDEEEETVLYLN